MPWREVIANQDLLVFTTAELRWRPLIDAEPNGAQIATLWGDPGVGAFGAVVRLPSKPADVYTLIRRNAPAADVPRSSSLRSSAS